MKKATDPTPKAIPLAYEDVAHLADGSGELPADTAARLKVFIRCDDLEQVQQTWRLIGSHREELRRMAEDAGVELLVDAVFAFRILEQLRAEPWESPGDLLHPGIEVPYPQLISMATACAERAGSTEKAELLRLRERLVLALGNHLGGEEFVEGLIDRLLEVREEVAEEALEQLVEVYRNRRAVAAG